MLATGPCMWLEGLIVVFAHWALMSGMMALGRHINGPHRKPTMIEMTDMTLTAIWSCGWIEQGRTS